MPGRFRACSTSVINWGRTSSCSSTAYIFGIAAATRGFDRPAGVITAADAPSNPFAQPVLFSFPAINLSGGSRQAFDTYRVVSGAIVTLPAFWQAEAEFGFGSAIYDTNVIWQTLSLDSYFLAIRNGRPGIDGQPPLSPLGDWRSFQDALATYAQRNFLGSISSLTIPTFRRVWPGRSRSSRAGHCR